ncbi:MAG: hypothetical protein GX633_09395 [Clostridiales bacterium]|jgi:hypothetical protein|nr:hypothetical protein [Clostridiales bacterium]
MKKQIKLYNVMFPVWMILMFPIALLVVLPVNFAIDSAVLLLTLRHLNTEGIKNNYLKSIFRIWLYGFLADIIGTLFMLLGGVAEFGDFWYEHITTPIMKNPFRDWLGLAYTLLCIAISGVCIYFFNYKLALRKTTLTDREKRTVSIMLAVFTAPYLFLLPSAWIY